VWLLPFLSPSPWASGSSFVPNPCRACSPHWRNEQTGRRETRFWGRTGGSTERMWGMLPISNSNFGASRLLHLQVLNHEPAVPTRPDQRYSTRSEKGKPETHLVAHLGRYVPSAFAVSAARSAKSPTDDGPGGTVPANWQQKRDILGPKMFLPPPKLGSQTPKFGRLNLSAVMQWCLFYAPRSGLTRLVDFPLSRSGLWPPPKIYINICRRQRGQTRLASIRARGTASFCRLQHVPFA
jgi:hypothetical protein